MSLLIIADRVTRNKNFMKLLEMTESKDFAKTLDSLMSVAYDSYKKSPYNIWWNRWNAKSNG